MSDPFRVGVALPVHGTPGSWPSLRDLAARIETAGFDSLWASDHSDAGTSPPNRGRPDALVLLSALAVATRRIRLGTLGTAVGLRPPSVLAKAAASLDRLSGGRFELGLGEGWTEAGYAASDLREDGPAELEEAALLIRAMVSESPATVEGDRFHTIDAPNLPQPAQDHLPVMVAAYGPRAMRSAARVADTWNVAWRISPESYAARVEEFDRSCADVGRDPARIRRSLGLLALVGENPDEVARRFEDWRRRASGGLDAWSIEDLARDALVGTVEQVAERIEAYRRCGVTDLLLNFSPFDWSYDGGWDIFASEILPDYARASR